MKQDREVDWQPLECIVSIKSNYTVSMATKHTIK